MMIGHAMIAVCATTLGDSIQLAYVGPGGGLAAIGALLAVVAGLAAAVFGFVWYPLKRILRRKNSAAAATRDGDLT